jgi:hypothetical protein
MTWLSDIDNAGWLVLPVTAAAKRLYVSSGAGNDANDGSSEGKPLKTLAAAFKRLEKGRQNVVSLKRGDVWREGFGFLPVGGKSQTEPLILNAYGSGERPQVRPLNTNGIAAHGKQFVVITGIHFRADKRHPTDSGFDPTGTGTYGISFTRSSYVWVEDCKVELFANCNIGIQASPDKREKEAVIRRNVIADSYNTKGHSQGLYTQYIDGLSIHENVFDHNGWLEGAAKATVFNHNVYHQAGCGPADVRGNIFARGSATGIQQRAGGDCVGNAFLLNPVAMTFGLVNGDGPMVTGGVGGSVVGNVVVGTCAIDGSPRGIGLILAHTKPGANVRVAENVFANDPQKMHACIQIQSGQGKYEADGVGLNDATIENNIVDGWKSALSVEGEMKAGGSGKNSINRVTVRNNRFDGIEGGAKLGAIVPAKVLPYVNAAVASDDYSGWLTEARKQSRTNWRAGYTAAAFVQRIKDGFKAKAVEPTPTTPPPEPKPEPPAPPVVVPVPVVVVGIVIKYSDGTSMELRP